MGEAGVGCLTTDRHGICNPCRRRSECAYMQSERPTLLFLLSYTQISRSMNLQEDRVLDWLYMPYQIISVWPLFEGDHFFVFNYQIFSYGIIINEWRCLCRLCEQWRYRSASKIIWYYSPLTLSGLIQQMTNYFFLLLPGNRCWNFVQNSHEMPVSKKNISKLCCLLNFFMHALRAFAITNIFYSS